MRFNLLPSHGCGCYMSGVSSPERRDPEREIIETWPKCPLAAAGSLILYQRSLSQSLESPSLDGFKNRLDMALRAMVWLMRRC